MEERKMRKKHGRKEVEENSNIIMESQTELRI
jgi:hypothetical protein